MGLYWSHWEKSVTSLKSDEENNQCHTPQCDNCILSSTCIAQWNISTADKHISWLVSSVIFLKSKLRLSVEPSAADFRRPLVPITVSSSSRSSCLLMRFPSTDTSAQRRGHCEAYAMTRVDRLCWYADEEVCRPQSQDVILWEVKRPSRQKVRMETQTSPTTAEGRSQLRVHKLRANSNMFSVGV